MLREQRKGGGDFGQAFKVKTIKGVIIADKSLIGK